MKRTTLLTGALLTLAGCATTVTSVRGWNGPPMTITVTAEGGIIDMQAPTGGWTLHVDRAAVADNVGTLWLTATPPAGPATMAITPVQVTWAAPQGRSARCLEAMVRVGPDGRYTPATEACR